MAARRARVFRWLDPAEILAEIGKSVDVYEADGSCGAFSEKGVVYVMPVFVHDVIVGLSARHGVALDPGRDIRALVAKVVDRHFGDMLSEKIPKGYGARMCSAKVEGRSHVSPQLIVLYAKRNIELLHSCVTNGRRDIDIDRRRSGSNVIHSSIRCEV